MSQRILIAEDDELQGAVLRVALERRGYEAEIVTDGLQAVRRLRTGQYDLGLLDYGMPEVNGLAAARLLHDFLSEADRPRLIAVTAAAEAVQQSLASEGQAFDAVVSKRLGLPALLTVVDTHLAGVAQRKAWALPQRQAVVTARGRNQKVHLAATPLIVPGKDEPSFEQGFVPGTRNLPLLDDPFAIPPNSDGQVQAISLAAFKVALGPEWPRVSLRAMLKAEHIIKRRLIGGEVVSRSGDHSFVVWFNTTDAKRNEAVLAAAAREIRIRLLTDFGEETTPDICTAPSAVRQYLPARDEGWQ